MAPEKRFKLISFSIIVLLLASALNVAPATQAVARAAAHAACRPGMDWRWVGGPEQPDTALQAQRVLKQKGIDSTVKAYGFGEVDSCGNFRLSSTDFSVTLAPGSAATAGAQAEQSDRILDELGQFAAPLLGNVRITYQPGQSRFFPAQKSEPDIESEVGAQSAASAVLNKNVFLLIYDPVMSNGQDLISYMSWTPSETLAQQISDAFKSVSHGQLQYTVAASKVLPEWPVKVDGFRYTATDYLDVYNHITDPHDPDLVDYNAIIDDPDLDICGKLNRGEIDELWIYGAPYDGFYESRLVGPGAYDFNSPPMDGAHGCNRLLPIMGLSYERGLAEALESFGHRSEAIMTKVYGSWDENRTDHNWDRYALDRAQSPDYAYSGCGRIHYPPNGVQDYDWNNRNPVLSNCEDFKNYPNLNDAETSAQMVDCHAWGCTDGDDYAGYQGYMLYWYSHLPANNGFGPDSVSNNWWQYLSNPGQVLTYLASPCPVITHWKGEYWDNSDMSGDPLICRDDSAIAFDWREGSPDSRLPLSNFSVRWTRNLYFSANTYRFWITHQDGARLYIDDQLVLDKSTSCCTLDSVKLTLPAGNHAVRMEMSNTSGSAYASLWWTNPPGVPTPVSPPNRALTTNYRPTLDWKNSTLPSGTTFDNYQVQLAATDQFETPLFDENQTGRASSEFTPESDLAPGQTYYWRVRAFNSSGNYSAWSIPRSFRTAILQPELDAPVAGETKPDRRPALDWENVDDAGSYTIQISAYASFKRVVMTGSSDISYFTPPADLPAHTPLYWRVRANGLFGPSAWSDAGSFTTGNPPGVPLPISPVNRAYTTILTPKLAWKPSSLPPGTTFAFYLVQLSANDDQFHHPLFTEQITDRAATVFTLASSLAPDTLYYWRVCAYNTNGEFSAWSAVRSFRTSIDPPLLSSPVNEEAGAELRPNLTWQKVDDATKYYVQISRYASFKRLLKATFTIDTGYTPTFDLPANVPLYWRVRAYGIYGPSAWSETWHFTSSSGQ